MANEIYRKIHCSDVDKIRKQPNLKVRNRQEDRASKKLSWGKKCSKETVAERRQYIGPNKVIMLLSPMYRDAAPFTPCPQ